MNTTTYLLTIPLGIALGAFLTAACIDDTRAEPARVSGGVSGDVTEQTEAVAMDPRDQYALVAALSAAERLAPDRADERYHQIYRDFRGKRYRWTAYRIAALCPSARRCNVVPFAADHRQKSTQGWMPRLELSEDAFAALESRCAAATDSKGYCKFQFEGTMSKLVVSTQHLTAMTFSDVRIR